MPRRQFVTPESDVDADVRQPAYGRRRTIRNQVRHRLPFLLRLGREEPDPVTGCPNDQCSKDKLLPVDVYCNDHERLIPFATNAPTAGRMLVVNGLRTLVCGSFLLAALVNSALPVYAMYVAAAAAVAVLPLHRYPLAWRVALGAWVSLAFGALAVMFAGPQADQILRSLVLAALLALLVCYFSMSAWSEGGSPGADRMRRAAGVVMAALALGPVALLAWVAWRVPSALLGQAPAWVSDLLLLAAVGAVTGAVLTAAIIGAIDGQSHVNHEVDPLVKPPKQARPVDWVTATRRPAATAGSWDRAFASFGHRSLIVTTVAAQALTNLLLRAAHLLAVVAVRLVNWLHRRIVMLWRRVWAALVSIAHVLRTAGARGRMTLGRATRGLLVPAAVLVAGAWLAVTAAEQTRRYLVTGSIIALAVLAGALLFMTMVLSAVWIALSGQRSSPALASAGRTASLAAPQGLLLLVVGGWAVGLPGTLGYGPIHVGWVTGTATALLLATIALFKWRRPGQESPALTAHRDGRKPGPNPAQVVEQPAT